MTRADEQIVPATMEDCIAIYGKPPPIGFLGFAVRKNGKAIGLAGIYIDSEVPIVFSQINEPISKRTILAVSYKVLGIAVRKKLPLCATCDRNVPTSESFMRHFGFEPVPGYEGVFKWGL